MVSRRVVQVESLKPEIFALSKLLPSDAERGIQCGLAWPLEKSWQPDKVGRPPLQRTRLAGHHGDDSSRTLPTKKT